MDKVKPLMEAHEFHDRLCEGRLTRRQAHRVLASAGVGVMTTSMASGVARADGSDVMMLTWGGYDDAAFGAEYAAAYGSPPSYSLFADQAEALAKIRSGFEVDVAFPCISKVKTWYDAGVIVPMDVGMLSHWGEMFAPLQDLPSAVTPEGPLFAPIDWGQTAVLFRTDMAPQYVDNPTWGILWDPEFAGRLGALEAVEDHFNVAATYLGIDFRDMNQEEIQLVADKVREQMPLLRMVTGDTTSLTQALFSGELVATAAWNGMMLTATSEMAAQGTEGLYSWMIPKEGAHTWVCGLVVTPQTKERGLWEQAHALVDAYLAPESQHYELMNWGYGVSNAKAFEYEDVTEEYLSSLGLGLPVEDFLASGKFSTHQEHYGEIVNIYDEILAGM